MARGSRGAGETTSDWGWEHNILLHQKCNFNSDNLDHDSSEDRRGEKQRKEGNSRLMSIVLLNQVFPLGRCRPSFQCSAPSTGQNLQRSLVRNRSHGHIGCCRTKLGGDASRQYYHPDAGGCQPQSLKFPMIPRICKPLKNLTVDMDSDWLNLNHPHVSKAARGLMCSCSTQP